LYCYEVDNDSILVTKYSTNDKPEIILYSNSLTIKQKLEFERFFSGFSLSEMKENYINQNVQGSRHDVYEIAVDGFSKTITVYIMDVPELIKLTELIEKCLPTDRKGWYENY